MPPARRKPLPALAIVIAFALAAAAILWWPRTPVPTGPILPSSFPARSIEPPDTHDRDTLLRAEAEHYQQLKQQPDPARALEMANEGHERYVRGNLFPDREAIAIRSLVRLGRQEEARSRAQRFVSRFPQHPQVEAVRKFAGLGT